MSAEIPVDTLLLDLDGTLAESLPGIEYSVRAALAACGLRALDRDFRELVGPPIRHILKIISGCEGEQLDGLERAFRDSYDRDGWLKTVLYPGVEPTLTALAARGLRMFVVTNKPRTPTERILGHLGIAPHITAICSPDSRKPPFRDKAEAAAELLRDWNLSGSGALLAGDARDDARAAHACGCRFAGVDFGYGNACSQREYPVHFHLRRFDDLIRVLGGGDSAIIDQTLPTIPNSSL